MLRGGFQTHCSCFIIASLTWLKSVKSCAESWSCSRSASACMPASQSFTRCFALFVSATIFLRLCRASFAARASHLRGKQRAATVTPLTDPNRPQIPTSRA